MFQKAILVDYVFCQTRVATDSQDWSRTLQYEAINKVQKIGVLRTTKNYNPIRVQSCHFTETIKYCKGYLVASKAHS